MNTRFPPLKYQPVIVLGAPRSGTNLLRDLLCATPGVETWPCDEINYLWRHGDPGRATDELTGDDATPQTIAYLRNCFSRQAKRSRAKWLIEKTCANCLRVEFVRRTFPDAKLVVIHRDGRDVVASARLRWQGGFNLNYVLRKARYVPVSDMPFYGRRFAWDRAAQLLASKQRVRSWGPRFDGLDELARSASTAVVCAEQWLRCVEGIESSLANSPTENVYRLSYESLVTAPDIQLARLSLFLGVRLVRGDTPVSQRSVGAWRKKLSQEDLTRVLPRIEPTLERLGYLNTSSTAA